MTVLYRLVRNVVVKQMDSHVTFMFNFVLTVLGAFAFGYKAVEYSLATPNTSLVS